MAQALPHPVMYAANQQQMHYLPQYYSTPYAQYGPSSYPERTLKTERRRPKYTRSKTGCLTCRKKKVKCDETKPTCQRCSNSQLSCTWPEVPPPKKKGPSRKGGRTPADQADSATTSEAGTSSVSPTDTTHPDATPHAAFRSEAPSPEIYDQEGASCASSLAFTDPNMLHVGNSLNNDRRYSEPHLVPSLESSTNEIRRHSMADITDGQQYVHHNSRQEHHYHNQSSSASSNGALGLSLNQLGANTRPSTPGDFLYPHPARAPGGTQASSSGFLGFSPSSGVSSIIPNISAGSTSSASRPSTAASSLSSFSHTIRRTPATSSRPSTAGSYGGGGTGASGGTNASINGHGHQFMHHRPASSNSGSGSGSNDYEYPPLGFSPFSFQLGRTSACGGGGGSGEVSLDGGSNAMSGYTSACISRPSTANSVSVPSAAPSPYMQHGVVSVSLDGCGGVGGGGGGLDRSWRSSPLLGQSPLAQPQPQVVVGSGLSGYFQQMTNSPALHSHSRTQSPAWAC